MLGDALGCVSGKSLRGNIFTAEIYNLTAKDDPRQNVFLEDSPIAQLGPAGTTGCNFARLNNSACILKCPCFNRVSCQTARCFVGHYGDITGVTVSAKLILT